MDKYDGCYMWEVYKELVENYGLNGEYFDVVVEDLLVILKEMGVFEDLIVEVVVVVGVLVYKWDVFN